MFVLQNISYIHPDKQRLFASIDLTVNNHDKIALIGNNGSGKSTLLKIIARELQPSEGQLTIDAKPYYVPQLFGQYNHLTVAQALQVEDKINALKSILDGNLTEDKLDLLHDDWTIGERCNAALSNWQLTNIHLAQKMGTLSGGQKTKIFLAGIAIHQPRLILLDEPTNHLDMAGRQLLYDFISVTRSTLVVVSHDRKLLNLLEPICELNPDGVTVYGGNYAFYAEQKQIKHNALRHDIHSREKALRKAKQKEQKMVERRQKLEARGKKKLQKAGVARIVMNTLKNSAENNTSKIKTIHAEKTSGISEELQDLRAALPVFDKMKVGFDNPLLHKGKILLKATHINYSYRHQFIWKNDLNFQITSGERVALKGVNGSGKTTLIKLILGDLGPKTGTIYRGYSKSLYIDQDYSLIDNALSVCGQAQRFNDAALQEHEVKIRLNRFLFAKEGWDKPCGTLSGGEKMRLILCCLTMNRRPPDIIIFDEPTNNLDIKNIEILTSATNEYQGTLIVVSHDAWFLEQINIGRTIKL